MAALWRSKAHSRAIKAISTIDGNATLELSNGTGQFVAFEGGSATFKLDAPAAFTGAIEDVVVGDAIDLAGITATPRALQRLDADDQRDQRSASHLRHCQRQRGRRTPSIASDNNGGRLVYWGSAGGETQYWITGAAGDWSDAADWVSGAVPGVDGWRGDRLPLWVRRAASDRRRNGGGVFFSTLDPYSTLTVSGTLTLGTALTVDDYATLKLSGGTLSAQSISSNNNGYLFGYGVVSGAVSGGVRITADGGALQVQGSLAGDQGNFTIDGGASPRTEQRRRRAGDFRRQLRHLQARRTGRVHRSDRRRRRRRRDRSRRDHGEFRDLQRLDADDQRDQRPASHLRQCHRQPGGRRLARSPATTRVGRTSIGAPRRRRRPNIGRRARQAIGPMRRTGCRARFPARRMAW